MLNNLRKKVETMANKENSMRCFNQLTREINLLQYVEIPEANLNLQKAYMELENIRNHKRSEKVRERYNLIIKFYEEHKKQLEEELADYQNELSKYFATNKI